MILVVGAGPAGMAAAVRARECGTPVTVLDDNPAAGGQIWRGGKGSGWFRKFQDSGAVLLTSHRVIGGDATRRILQVETSDGFATFSYEALILATGARELFLPFPGWTLPNVVGVGGLQAMVKSGLPIKGKRIVVAGSGPLLLAVARYLRSQGATVPVVAEQAPWMRLVKFAARLSPAKLLQAVPLQTAAYQPGTWVTRAAGKQKLERVSLSNGKTIACDYLAVSYGFVPSDELATLLGNSNSIYRAGECTGIGGVELSLVEGEMAGYTAAGREDLARKLSLSLDSSRRFAENLNRTFAPRSELRGLCQADTIVCRCEDVALGQLKAADSWRAAKLYLRCGMGPCQGRICGPAVNFLFHWQTESIRPPIFPARLSSLISMKEPIDQ